MSVCLCALETTTFDRPCGPAGRPHEACFISRSHRPRQRASWSASHLLTTWRSQQVALPSTCERAGVQRHQVGSGRQDTSYRKQGSGHGRADLLRHEQRRADEHAKPAGAGSAPRRRDLAVRLRRGHAAPHDGDARDAEPDTAHLRQIVFWLGSATWPLATVALLLRWAPIAAVARSIGRIPHAMCITTRTTRGSA